MFVDAPKITVDDKYDIVVLIGSLLMNIGSLSEEQLFEVLLTDDMVNYFELATALGVMEERKLTETVEIGGKSVYRITEEGRFLCTPLLNKIPVSIAEKAAKVGKEVYDRGQRERALKIEVLEENDACYLHIVLLNETGGPDIMEFKLYAPNYVEAIRMKKRFIAHSDSILKNILNQFTD